MWRHTVIVAMTTQRYPSRTLGWITTGEEQTPSCRGLGALRHYTFLIPHFGERECVLWVSGLNSTLSDSSCSNLLHCQGYKLMWYIPLTTAISSLTITPSVFVLMKCSQLLRLFQICEVSWCTQIYHNWQNTTL